MHVDQWIEEFRKFLERQPGFERVLARIVRAGCEEATILELLYDECYTNPCQTIEFKKSLQDEIREARRLADETESLAHRVQRMNEFVLAGIDLEENLFLIKTEDGKAAVPVSNFDYLPQLLCYYSQRLRLVAESKPDLEEIDNRGPELTILGVYIREITGDMPYKVQRDLLEAANIFLDQSSYQSAEAIRKRLERYKIHHPHAYQVAEESIAAYVARRKAHAPEEPHFWETLYENLYGPQTDDIIKKQPRG